MERLPPMITPPPKEVRKPATCRGASRVGVLPYGHDATHRGRGCPPEIQQAIVKLLLQCYCSRPWRLEGDGREAPSKCTKKAVVLDCAHFRLERGKGSK